MTIRKKQSLIRQVLAIQRRTKELYKRKDDKLAQLIAAMPLGEEITVGDQTFHVVDNFATKNKVWTAAGVARFELAEKKPLPARPKRKAAEPEEVLP